MEEVIQMINLANNLILLRKGFRPSDFSYLQGINHVNYGGHTAEHGAYI